MRFNNCHLRSFVQLLLIAELEQVIFFMGGGFLLFIFFLEWNTDRVEVLISGMVSEV